MFLWLIAVQGSPLIHFRTNLNNISSWLGLITENAVSTFPLKARTSLLLPLKGEISFSASPTLIYSPSISRNLRVSAAWGFELVSSIDLEDWARTHLCWCSPLCWYTNLGSLCYPDCAAFPWPLVSLDVAGHLQCDAVPVEASAVQELVSLQWRLLPNTVAPCQCCVDLWAISLVNPPLTVGPQFDTSSCSLWIFSSFDYFSRWRSSSSSSLSIAIVLYPVSIGKMRNTCNISGWKTLL